MLDTRNLLRVFSVLKSSVYFPRVSNICSPIRARQKEFEGACVQVSIHYKGVTLCMKLTSPSFERGREMGLSRLLISGGKSLRVVKSVPKVSVCVMILYPWYSFVWYVGRLQFFVLSQLNLGAASPSSHCTKYTAAIRRFRYPNVSSSFFNGNFHGLHKSTGNHHVFMSLQCGQWRGQIYISKKQSQHVSFPRQPS